MHESARALLQIQSVIRWVWGRTWESAYLTSSQLMPVMLILGSHCVARGAGDYSIKWIWNGLWKIKKAEFWSSHGLFFQHTLSAMVQEIDAHGPASQHHRDSLGSTGITDIAAAKETKSVTHLVSRGHRSCWSTASASLSPSICCLRASEWPDLAARESGSLFAFQAL